MMDKDKPLWHCILKNQFSEKEISVSARGRRTINILLKTTMNSEENITNYLKALGKQRKSLVYENALLQGRRAWTKSLIFLNLFTWEQTQLCQIEWLKTWPGPVLEAWKVRGQVSGGHRRLRLKSKSRTESQRERSCTLQLHLSLCLTLERYRYGRRLQAA